MTGQLSVGRRAGVYFLIVLVQLISALYTVLTRDAIQKGNADPLIFSLYRDACAFPLLYLWAFLMEHLPRGCCKKAKAKHDISSDGTAKLLLDEEAIESAEPLKAHGMCPRCRDVPRFIALGLFGMFGNQFCYIMALDYITSDVAAILNLSQIVFVAVLAASPVARWLGADQEKYALFFA